MRAVIQRVSEAEVRVEGVRTGAVKTGLVILLGIESDDLKQDAEWLAAKIAALRIFADDEGKMNRNLLEVEGASLVVSQFTLHAKTKKGNRPSFIRAAKPEYATPLYQHFIDELKNQSHRPVNTGVFGAMMEVHLVNDGPVTIIIDTKNKE